MLRPGMPSVGRPQAAITSAGLWWIFRMEVLRKSEVSHKKLDTARRMIPFSNGIYYHPGLLAVPNGINLRHLPLQILQ